MINTLSDIGNNNYGTSSIGQRWFDPQGSAERFNAYQASLERDFNANEAQKQRDFNANEAQKQRDYEERLSGSAYQRAVADMRSAGLNPYLFYSSGGSGASTPSGASAVGASASSGSGARSSGGQNLLGQIVSSAFGLAQVAVGSHHTYKHDYYYHRW